MRERDRPIGERLSVLDRPRSDSDTPDYSPSVARFISRLSDPTGARLVYADAERLVYLGAGVRDGVEHVHRFIRTAHGRGSGGFPRSALGASGVAGIALFDKPEGRHAILGVVPDAVLGVRVGDVDGVVTNNVLFADFRVIPEEIVLITAEGPRTWRFPRIG